eukprot:3795680-Pleurochrysis_carterae.AAC.1
MVAEEVERRDVGHCELHAEAEAVGHKENPRVDVAEAKLDGHVRLGLLLRSRCLELAEVAIRQVPTREHKGRAHEVHGQGHNIAQAPRKVLVLAGGAEKSKHDVRHHEIGDAASKVAPAAGGGVGSADNRFVEELRAPDLARDKRSQAKTNNKAAEDEAGGREGEGDADDTGDGEHEDEDKGSARAKLFAQPARDETHADRAGDGSDVGVLNILLGQVEIALLLDVRHERCGREGREEGRKKSEGGCPETCGGTTSSTIIRGMALRVSFLGGAKRCRELDSTISEYASARAWKLNTFAFCGQQTYVFCVNRNVEWAAKDICRHSRDDKVGCGHDHSSKGSANHSHNAGHTCAAPAAHRWCPRC